MTALITRHSTAILLSLLAAMLALAWAFPASGLKLGVAFLSLSFLIASLAALEKHRQAYRRGEIGRRLFIRNAALEIGATFLVMLLAGLLGRSAAGVAAQGIGHELLRTVAGVAVSLLVGLGVGALARKSLRRWV